MQSQLYISQETHHHTRHSLLVEAQSSRGNVCTLIKWLSEVKQSSKHSLIVCTCCKQLNVESLPHHAVKRQSTKCNKPCITKSRMPRYKQSHKWPFINLSSLLSMHPNSLLNSRTYIPSDVYVFAKNCQMKANRKNGIKSIVKHTENWNHHFCTIPFIFTDFVQTPSLCTRAIPRRWSCELMSWKTQQSLAPRAVQKNDNTGMTGCGQDSKLMVLHINSPLLQFNLFSQYVVILNGEPTGTKIKNSNWELTIKATIPTKPNGVGSSYAEIHETNAENSKPTCLTLDMTQNWTFGKGEVTVKSAPTW